ncbi:SH3 domain-containing protein [Campylobacter sp. 7477a]|uniref:SH3 domain-containing protein n=1 Tax=Campylobacter sp. 7477a TaxID=2735741 RepID=UPI003014C6CF|nr:SH3 domain-containing protein [Campylobacter sp. 7477a]
MKNKILSVFFLLFLLGCSQKVPQVSLDQTFKGRITLLDFELPQDANFLPQSMLSASFSGDDLLKNLFSVYDINVKNVKQDEAFWAFNTYKFSEKKSYFGSNFRPVKKAWFDKQRQNANFNEFGKLSAHAITTANTALRNFPSSDPLFYNPQLPGEGYPFDYAQSSTLSIAHPLFVSHFSLDKAWVFVKDDTVWGWIKSEDIKILTKQESSKYKKQNFLAVKIDNTPVYDLEGGFLFYARVGVLLGFNAEDKENFYGEVITRAGVRKYKISKHVSGKFPLAFDDENIRILSQSLLNQPYGWGGVNNLRDCSLFLKDLMSSFGFWLPRNSGAQAKMGKKIELQNLNAKEKIKLIKEQGVPYMTLFHLPGHIMLYVGTSNEGVLALHDAWGVRTKDNGRALMGGVVLTTLEIGKGRGDIDDKNLLLSKVISMNILQTPSGKKPEILPLNSKIDMKEKISKLQDAYGVRIEDNLVYFSDESHIVFNDFIKKDSECSVGADVQDMNALPYAALMPLNAPLNDSGRCRNYELLGKIYGDNKEAVRENLTDVVWLKDFLGLKLKFNSKNGAAKALNAVSQELNELVKQDPSLLEFLKDPAGTFNWRVIAGTNRPSAHSYGIAIDVNVKQSHYWRWHKVYKNQIPEAIVHTFEKHKFIWGGRWEHFDTMHFEYRPEMF